MPPSGSPPFADDPRTIRLVDQIARRRGKWAWEVLELTPEQLALESICLDFAEGERADLLRDLAGREIGVQPVLVVGDY